MKNKKISSLSFVFMLVIGTVAFAFLIGSETGMVNGFIVGDEVTYNGKEAIVYETPNENSQLLAGWIKLDNGDGSYTQIQESLVSFVLSETEDLLDSEDRTPSNVNEPTLAAPIVSAAPAPAPTPEVKAPEQKPTPAAPADNALGTGNQVTPPVNPSDKLAFGGKYDVSLLKYGNVGYLAEGLAWSVGIAVFIKAIGGIFPNSDQNNVNAMSVASAAGMMSFKVMQQIWGKGGWVNGDKAPTSWAGKTLSNTWTQAGVGVAVAWMVYNSMYEKTKTRTEVVTFSCLPWQAPHGGKDCELCNDGTLPCSEYRCKALGQSCSIINKGTSSERCVNTNPRDVSSPIIKPWDEKLTEGFSYFDVKEMPPGAGFKIKSTTSTTGCIEPFTPIQFGITTDEPAQCKIDVEPKGNYSKMTSYFGGDNLYSYNHTETLSLPSVENIKNSSLTLQNGKELSFYMRCRDANGNTNEADYELKVCVDPSPDTTAPVILGTSIQTGGCVSAESENSTVDFYLNEPSECKWSFTDSSYDQMQNNMSCSSYATQMNALTVFTCNALLTGIARDGTNFFVKCKDKPGSTNGTKNQESYPFSLRGSGQLKLKMIRPNETIYGVLNPTAIELYAETLFGCEDNKAICYYSTSDSESSYTQFFDTNNADGVSTQRLDLTSGTYTYFVKCVDAGGNLVKNSTSFKVSIDSNAPIIARVYEEDSYLKIVTPINSKCVYTNDNCDYLFQEGIIMPYEDSTTHVTEWSPIKKYYIKCIDEFRSEPADCSLVVGPTDNFLQ